MSSPLPESEALVRCEEVLQHLEDVSFVAQRDARAALPSLANADAQTRLHWLEAARDLFFHDREAGKAFMRRTPELVALWPDIRRWTDHAQTFREWVNSWYALDGYLAQAGHIFEEWGEAGVQGWFDTGRRWCTRSIEDGRVYFEADYARLADGEGLSGIEALLAPAERLYDARRLTLETYLPGALVARNVVGTPGLEPWARRGADLMQSGRSRGEAYFRLANEEGLRYLLDELPGYRPRQHSRFLQMLLLAWFDELIPLADSDWRPGKGAPMMLCDGRSLLMPAVLADRDEAIAAALHTAAHLRFDTYAGEEVEALFEARGMAHPPLDDDQRITWRPLFAEFGERLFRFQVLFDLCEDLRVDSRLGALVPGYFSRLTRLLDRAETPAGAAGYFYDFARVQLRAVIAGEALDARLALLTRPQARLLDAYEVAIVLFADTSFPELDAADRDLAYLPAHGLNTGLAVYPRPRYEVLHDAPHADAYSEHKATRERQREDQPQQAPGQRQDDPDADINQSRENTSGSGGRIGTGIPMPAKHINGRGATRKAPPGGIPYPEWDYREQRYLHDWARVHESRLTETAFKRAERILSEHAGVLKRLRSALEMQRPSRPAPLRRQPDGDDLDMEATVSYVTEKRAGLSPEGLIYRRRAAQHRDTAVMLLADLSTSIMARHPSGQGKVIDRIRSGLILFSEAITSLGDPYAISGFASKHHDNVNYYVVKDFAEPSGGELNARLAALSGRLASRMGAAIRHSIRRFASVDSHHRLLLLLTDGRPADYDDGGDPRYLNDDTRMAMKEARDAGIHPFCITLDPSGGDYLPAIFGPGHYTLIDRVDELPARLPEIYLRLRR
ncbi:VWA domain-containing protein [Acidihalobacter yilgarnensis]|uniref:VWA domain-containing protein n=1 Tax=Acidihalobacter yilgarnensis TaxID=2819280 RepID=A0A1D8ILI5_9GAMM|nr:VWA domain-containing protein [Acidihalobacter yilgarnensis]AOU97323.1 VWA domain-containing protein [Acidihalobacter yilgarnensis]